jgi:hypothetical protein
MDTVPVFQTRTDSNGEWIVAVRWPSGHIRDYRGFINESTANEWAAKKMQTWLKSSRKDA